MNGEPLPLEHGFPVRMVVPGLYGYVSATKWLTELKVTTFDADEAYWTPARLQREGADQVLVAHRHPAHGRGRSPPAALRSPASPGRRPSASTASRCSIDDGDWQPATLSTPINDDTWVQWFVDWDATAGTHYVAVRAVNKNGDVQIEERAPIAPDGSTGWQRTLIRVSS